MIENNSKLASIAAVALSAAIAIATGLGIESHNRAQREAEFDILAQRVIQRVGERIKLYEYGLRGARGAVIAVGPADLTRVRFQRYIASRNLADEFPGANGFGFIRRVAPEAIDTFVRTARSDGHPDFTIRQLTSHAGDLAVIQYIEPEVSNASAFGLDIFSEPNRAEAAAACELKDAPVLSGPITLVQKPGLKEGGILLMLPVFAEPVAPSTPDARRGAAVGWVYAPLILREVMSGFDFFDGAFSLAIDDVTPGFSATRAYSSEAFDNPPSAGLGKQYISTLYERQWRYELRAREKFIASLNQHSPANAALGALVFMLALTSSILAYLQSRQRARLAHDSHAQLAAIVESSSDAIIGKRIDGTVTAWNRAAEEMFGYTREEAIGRSLASLVIPPEMMEEEVRILGRIATGERIPHFETIRQRKDGQRLHVSVSVSPIRDARGMVIGASKSVRDVTRQKEAESKVHMLNATLESQVVARTHALNDALDQAKQASRSKAEFLANMSHEIRTPMNAVLGLAYLAEQQCEESSTKELLRKISQSGRSLLGVINDILDFSKIEEGRLELECIPFKLSEVLDNLSTIMGSSGGDKAIELVIAPPPKGVRQLRGDGLRLEQILINLVSNAIKFTEAGHIVLSTRVVATEKEGITLRFSVQDTGIGIPLDKQAAIFAPFTQADASTTRRFGGTGLGLAICRQLVELMGGEIGVVSAEGHGSEFWFTARFDQVEDAEISAPEMTGLNVLVADDSAVALQALKSTSEQLGWRTQGVDNGMGAIATVLENSSRGEIPDVLVIDWQMPDKNGLEVARAVRENLSGAETPIVIMVTAYSREQLASAKDSDLADALLTKPVTSSTLYNAVASALHRRGRGTVAAALPRTQASRRLDRLRLLIVDDSEINRDLADRIFSAEGASVDTANDGTEAVAIIERTPRKYDAILMDVQMPRMDGLEATSRIRRIDDCRDLPIIALTAGAFAAQREEALSAGMNAVVTKPFDVNRTVALILECCGKDRKAVTEPAPEKAPDRSAMPGLSDLAGIDIEYGLQIWQDETIYRQYLRRFAKDYQSFVDQLGGLEPSETNRALHKLKGAAASLGLNELSICAGHLDGRLHAGKPEAAELKSLGDALEMTLKSINLYTATDSIPPSASAQLNPEDATQGIAKLFVALDQDNPNEILPLIEALDSSLPPQSLARVRDLVETFSFRAAEEELRNVARLHSIPVENS